MAGTSIRVEVDASAAVASAGRANEALARPSTLLAAIGGLLLRSTTERFAAQASPEGNPWQALSPRYKARKKYNPDKILTLRGYLRGQLRYQLDGDDAVLVGSNRVYARIHQLGGDVVVPARSATLHFRNTRTGGRVRQVFAKARSKRITRTLQTTIPSHTIHMPARPFLGVSASDRDDILAQTQDWLHALLSR